MPEFVCQGSLCRQRYVTHMNDSCHTSKQNKGVITKSLVSQKYMRSKCPRTKLTTSNPATMAQPSSGKRAPVMSDIVVVLPAPKYIHLNVHSDKYQSTPVMSDLVVFLPAPLCIHLYEHMYKCQSAAVVSDVVVVLPASLCIHLYQHIHKNQSALVMSDIVVLPVSLYMHTHITY